MKLKNANSNYPIRGVPDNIPRVSYRTGPMVWIDSRVMKEWVKERQALSQLTDEKRRVIFTENCSGHAPMKQLKESLEEIKTSIRFLPLNATHIIQLADLIVI